MSSTLAAPLHAWYSADMIRGSFPSLLPVRRPRLLVLVVSTGLAAAIGCSCGEDSPAASAESDDAPSVQAASQRQEEQANGADTGGGGENPVGEGAEADGGLGAADAALESDAGARDADAGPATDSADFEARGVITNTDELARVGLAIEDAIEAAAANEEEGADPCEQGYRSIQTMMERLRAQMPDAPTQQLPPEADFVNVCRELPPEAQRCLTVTYALQHREECEAAERAIDPELRARVEGVMQAGAAE